MNIKLIVLKRPENRNGGKILKKVSITSIEQRKLNLDYEFLIILNQKRGRNYLIYVPNKKVLVAGGGGASYLRVIIFLLKDLISYKFSISITLFSKYSR